MAVYGSRCSHGGADQMGAPASALTALKVAVAGTGTALAWLQAVGVHGQAHRATRLAPFKTRSLEYFMQAFPLRLFFDQTRARYNHCQLDIFGHFLAQFLHHGSCLAHVLDAAVGA